MRLPPAHHDELKGRCWLRDLFRRRDVDRRPVTGAMAAYVGRQHDVAALAGSICFEMMYLFSLHDDAPEPTRAQLASLARVRAFAVPAIEGTRVSATGEAGFPAALEAHLRAIIPVAWRVGDDVHHALRKHFFCQTSLAAPIDHTTGAAMALQLYGDIVEYGGICRGTPAWDELLEHYGERRFRRLDAGQPMSPLAEPFTVHLEVATYANIQCPNVGVPFYI